jgi:hypothetical protein
MKMNKIITKLALIAGIGLFGQLVPFAAADQLDQKTTFTFSGPVEVPGQVLQAGTYVFKLVGSESDRNVVQIFSKDEKHLYGTFLSVPDEHARPAGKSGITFEENAAGAPEAVKEWIFPGEDYGHEFVYPNAKTGR